MVVEFATKELVPQCPKCGSLKLIKFGWKYDKSLSKKYGRPIKAQRYQCQNCGHIAIEPKWVEETKGGNA